jgi:glycine hydroxymethyltransferase
MAALMALCAPGDRVLAMSLDHGGHLSHGHPKNFSGVFYEFHHYGVGREDERIDMDEVRRLALEVRPRVLLAGASAYSRTLDFEAFSSIAKECGAALMVDMAHIAGLVAGGEHPSPLPFADVTTFTTHKTMRGPRGGAVLGEVEIMKKVNSALFPGGQGGPLMHVIAAKAIGFREALAPEFREYARAVVANAAALAERLQERGMRLVSGGTDNHLMLIDVGARGISGREAEDVLHAVDLTCNKNLIPYDERPPMEASGIRVGSAAVTTRGLGVAECTQIADWIADVLDAPADEAVAARVRGEVAECAAAHPIYEAAAVGGA